MIEQSKTCPEPFASAQDKLCRRIKNLKSYGDSAERAGASGQGDQVIRFLISDFGLWITRTRRKQVFRFALATLLFGLSVPAGAQQQGKIAKIGELHLRAGSTLGTGRELFRRSLRELGYIEGKNTVYETRSAEGKLDRFPTLAEELVRLKVDVLLTTSPDETLAAKNATKTIPIVYLAQADPAAVGLVDSLARPGGNITGVTTIATELSGKRLELLKETIRKLSRVAVMWNPKMSGQSWNESQLAARELGLQLHSMEVTSADQFESAFKGAIKAGSAALAVTQNPLISSTNQKQIVALAMKSRLPAIFPRGDYVANGGLMSYGADQAEPYRRAAVIVDKILKGAKPADIPIEQPTKFELVINLNTAKQIDLKIPQNVLARADRVIK